MFKHNEWTMNKYGVCWKRGEDFVLKGWGTIEFASLKESDEIHALAEAAGYVCRWTGHDLVWSKPRPEHVRLDR